MRLAHLGAPLVVVLALWITACTDATGGPTQSAATSAVPTASATPDAPVTVGPVDVFSIPVGTCIAAAKVSGTAEDVTLVECTAPHQTEAYAQKLLTGEWPGAQAAGAAAESFCYSEFTKFVGIPLEESRHDFIFLYPTADSWQDVDDRLVTCLATSPEPRTATLRGAAE